MQPLNQAPLGAQTLGTTAQAPTAPQTREVVQQAAPAGFDFMQYATHKAKAESSTSRKAPWECSVEELRERVTFRDVQAVSKRNDAEYHLRPFLSPKPLEMSSVLGNDQSGNPINTIIIPAELADATKDSFMERVVKAGLLDEQLLATAAQLKADKEERDAAPKKAPVNTAAADAALADLEATVNTAPVNTVPAQGVPAGIPAQGVPAQGVAPSMPNNIPVMQGNIPSL